ncbi:precorrin-2 dehydrogenase/sirohydrochlorin ferrochelatase family protein [Vibrio hepatarius]|jgi:precorrin-2 dehydrogenase/sirohydrochlorin ferrochelatase|uniref:precorrin-2 dehydrogenase n=1 Tax=Vibrio hepatarius TaxID=171383 RepID=A0A0M0I1D1_9VIBR|nr:bifunctional precorrin-2 dehydrogenase/sirohydrochlorin ferrochelatase [Vibrio hepatarius]KOO08120.1 ferrochelatase [Vibrio hepatarius]
MQYFPLFLNLKGKPVLVVGGGEVACRKVDTLVRAGAMVTIVSPQIEDYLRTLVDSQECIWIQNFYSKELLDKKFVQVWATTDNPELNHQVHRDAKQLGILVNVVDDLPYCDFITPSIINRGRIQLAISSGGASPVLVRNIREKLEAALPHNLALLADFGASKRNDIKQALPSVDSRRKFWENFFADPRSDKAETRAELEALYQDTLKSGVSEQGSITWIDFGDDVEMLPIKALRIMQEAELVLFPKQCPYSFIDLSRRDAERGEYASDSELADQLSKAKQNQLRIVVFVSPDSAQFNLLKNNDLHIKLGSQ